MFQGDTKATEAALKNIEDLNRKLGDSARQEVAKSGNAEKARELDESLQELAATSANLASALKEKGINLHSLYFSLLCFLLFFALC